MFVQGPINEETLVEETLVEGTLLEKTVVEELATKNIIKSKQRTKIYQGKEN